MRAQNRSRYVSSVFLNERRFFVSAVAKTLPARELPHLKQVISQLHPTSSRQQLLKSRHHRCLEAVKIHDRPYDASNHTEIKYPHPTTAFIAPSQPVIALLSEVEIFRMLKYVGNSPL